MCAKTKIIILCSVLGVVGLSIFAFVYYLNHDDYKYAGEYPDLYSIALDSIPDARGFIPGEKPFQPLVMLIEEDEYGRKMFCYLELGGPNAEIYLLIGQKSDGDYAYYYPHVDYAVAHVSEYDSRLHLYGDNPYADDPLLDFSDEQIDELKQANDWGQEINMEKCKEIKISRAPK